MQDVTELPGVTFLPPEPKAGRLLSVVIRKRQTKLKIDTRDRFDEFELVFVYEEAE